MDNCTVDSTRGECIGIGKVNDVMNELRITNKSLEDYQRRNMDSISNFGARIGYLEAREQVRDEQFKQFQQKLNDIKTEMVDFQRDNKTSLQELRKEHKESMAKLEQGNDKILEALMPLRHDVENLKRLEEDVDELKEKPAKTWEGIKGQALSWGIGIILAIIGGVLGLSRFL